MHHTARWWLLAAVLSLIHADPAGAAAGDPDFVRGYVAAFLEERGLASSSVTVRDGKVEISAALAAADLARLRQRLAARGIAEVTVAGRPMPVAASTTDHESLFRPLIASPRWPHFSAALQQYGKPAGFTHVGSVSFGESFRLTDPVAALGGDWQVGLQGAVFAIFDMDAASHDLVNADYFFGPTLAYRRGGFSALARLYHQSSHLGDEYLLGNRIDRSDRLNLSYEALDLKLSYELPLGWHDASLRLYGGASYIVHKDPQSLRRWGTQWGAELLGASGSDWGDLRAPRPFIAADIESRQENGWSADIAARAGVQFKLDPRDEAVTQLALEFFNGHSPNGQFYETEIRYFGLGLHHYFSY